MKGTMECQNRGSGSGTCEGVEVRVGIAKIEEVGVLHAKREEVIGGHLD